jgi:hypothetical protein
MFVFLFEHYKHPIGKRKDSPKVSSPEAIILDKKKKEKLSDPPYVPPEEVCNTRSKKNQNTKNHQKKWV